jgi:Domain of unknown function (DUF6484)
MESVGMKKEWLETVLEVASSPHEAQVVDAEALFELQEDISTLELQKTSEPPRLEGVVISTLVGLNNAGEPLVDFPANTAGEPMPARAAVTLGKGEIGREVALLFEGGDPRRPIIMGLIQYPERVQPTSSERSRRETQKPINAEVDGKRLVFTAKKEIVLRCGKASITLTRAGKVLVRGAYLLSRSSGVNRIKGGSVQIN